MKFLAVFALIALAVVSVSSSDCKPGTTFKRDCNSCFCTENGVAVCTLMACPPRPWGPLYVQGTKCPAQTFYSECNRCVCGRNGRSASCTLMDCEAFRPSE